MSLCKSIVKDRADIVAVPQGAILSPPELHNNPNLGNPKTERYYWLRLSVRNIILKGVIGVLTDYNTYIICYKLYS